MSTAYSYIRFSSTIQAKGGSYNRQIEKAQKYCEQHNLTLNAATYHDLGVSAYKQSKNNLSGGLGLFLDAANQGKIEVGSTLILESLDRLSRQAPTKAFALLVSIVDLGINVVTLIDNQEYTKANINDPAKLFLSIGSMLRAFDESKHKADRSQENWDRKRKQAVENKTPMTKNCPFWLIKNGNKFELIPEYAKIVRNIFDWYIGGMGYRSIANKLNDTLSFPPPSKQRVGKMWYDSTITNIIKNDNVIGIYKDIVDYFPAVISPEIFAQAQAVRNLKSSGAGGKRTDKNVLAHLCKCAHCGGNMIRFARHKAAGDWVYKMICNTGRNDKTKCKAVGWQYNDIENIVLNAVKEISIEQLTTNNADNEIKSLNANIVLYAHNIADHNKKIDRIMLAIENSDDDISELLNRLKTLKNEKTDYELLLKNSEQLLTAANSFESILNSSKNNVDVFRNLPDDSYIPAVNLALKKIISVIYLDNAKKYLYIHYKTGKVAHYFGNGEMIITAAIDAKTADEWFDNIKTDDVTVEKMNR